MAAAATPTSTNSMGATALLIIQGIGVLMPVAIDLAKTIKALLEKNGQTVILLPVLQGWVSNAAETQALITVWNAANPPAVKP